MKIESAHKNIYTDLDSEEPSLMLEKAQLCDQIINFMEQTNSTTHDLARLTGVSHECISDWLSGKFRHYSKDSIQLFVKSLHQSLM
jgi:predicted XRE-type DNA-binding protein